MRYKILLGYKGTSFAGWQKQPGDSSIQQTVEEAFSTILRQPIEVVGCGRTDAGVHARHYTAHMDAEGISDLEKITYQINSLLPADITIWNIESIHENFHARFDAIERVYTYAVHFIKDPFRQDFSFYMNSSTKPDVLVMQEVANLMLQFDDFRTFCKTGSDQHHYRCQVVRSEWKVEGNYFVFSIAANRFLRGMVRLIVGACLNAGFGKISVRSVEMALQNKVVPELQWSVPPQGLCFEYATYPLKNEP